MVKCKVPTQSRLSRLRFRASPDTANAIRCCATLRGQTQAAAVRKALSDGLVLGVYRGEVRRWLPGEDVHLHYLLPSELKVRVEARAHELGITVSDFVTRAVVSHLQRCTPAERIAIERLADAQDRRRAS